MYKLALANPAIAFKYVNNDNTVLQTMGDGDLENVIYSIYGRQVAANLINIDYKLDEISLRGMLGKAEIARANRTYQSLYVNSRYLKSKVVSRAVEEAFKTRITIGKYPFFVLFLDINSNKIDVNVHPQKMDVRFDDENVIFDFVFKAVSELLSKNNLLQTSKFFIEKGISPQNKEVKKKLEAVEKDGLSDFHKRQNKNIEKLLQNKNDGLELYQQKHEFDEDLSNLLVSDSALIIPSYAEKIEMQKEQNNQEIKFENQEEVLLEKNEETLKDTKNERISLFESEKSFSKYKLITRVFSTYLIVEDGDALYFVDQHAAHERIIYEEILKKDKNIHSQMLLKPEIVNLSVRETEFLKENIEKFNDLGFILDGFGDNTYALRAVPYIHNKLMASDFFTNLLDLLLDSYDKQKIDLTEDLMARMACRAAVKANDRLSDEEAYVILDSLFQLDNPYTCPHGRPTIVKMTKNDLEKMFKRI